MENSTTQQEKILVVIPAFNEEERIGAVIGAAKKYLPQAEILVINDGSTDRTKEVSLKAGAKVIAHAFNLGYGVAIQTGYKYAVRNNYQYVLQLDGDGQHDPVYLPWVLAKLKETDVDVVIGSRFISKEKYAGSFLRLFGISLFRAIVSLLTGQKITDPTSGYQGLKRRVVEFYCHDFFPVDYPDADVIFILHKVGFKIQEIPVIMHERKGGHSIHSGLSPLYYIFKMLLSLFVNISRRIPDYKI